MTDNITVSSYGESEYAAGAVPAKPFYGLLDFQAQLVIPRSQNPPVDPVVGSVYLDLDDGRIYIWTGAAWRPSALASIAGTGVVITVVDGAAVLSVAPPQRVPLTVTGDWTAGTPVPTRTLTAGYIVDLAGTVTSNKPLGGSAICTLPVGWRPYEQRMYCCAAGSSQANVVVNTDGTVVVVNGTGQPLRLGCITFSIA